MTNANISENLLSPDTLAPRSSTQIVNVQQLLLALALSTMLVAFSLLAFDWIKSTSPDEITLNIFGLSKVVHNIHDRIASVGLLILMFPIAFLIEAAFTGWKKSSFYRILFARNDSIKLDLACFAANELQIMNILKLILTFGLASFVGKFINGNLGFITDYTKQIANLPLLAQIPIFYVVYTFFDYWTHRIGHGRIFWPFHRFHHSATDFCIVTSMRQHPADFVSIFVINAPLAILGASTSVMIYVNIFVTIIGMIQHSNIDYDFGWLGKWIFQGPNEHRLHHVYDIETYKVGNFAIMPLWDRLFGTYVGSSGPELVLGVEKPYKQGYLFIIDTIRDYIDFWRGLFGANVDPYDFEAPKN